jgi:hypothetical protein
MMTEQANSEEATKPVHIFQDIKVNEGTSPIDLGQTIPEWLKELAGQSSEPETEPIAENQIDSNQNAEDVLPASNTGEWQPLQQQDFQSLLIAGQYQKAANLIRETADSPEAIQAAQQAIRPHLVLKDELIPLWDLYDELTIKLSQK